MTAIPTDLSIFIALVSAAFAVAMCAQMAWLLVRRRRLERRAISDKPKQRLLLRELMTVASTSGELADAPLFVAAEPTLRLDAVAHVLQMVRGADRSAILRVAEMARIHETAIANLDRGSMSRRIEALRVLEQVPAAASVDALRACMGNDASYDVRTEAAAALARIGQLPEPAVVIRMLDLQRRPLTRLHEALFRSAAARDGVKLARLANDVRYSRMRPLLVEALGWSGEFAFLKDLADHASDIDPEVRSSALKAARRLGHPGARPWAITLLLDPVDAVRVQAVRTCAALGARDAVPVLASLISSPSWWVRNRAKEALDVLRPEQRVNAGPTGFKL